MHSLDPSSPPLERPASRRLFDVAPPGWLFGPVFDDLLHLQRGDRVAFRAQVRAALHKFPDLAHLDRRRLLREIAVTDAVNRLIFRAGLLVPRLAKALSFAVPLVGRVDRFRAVPKTQPVIVALMHFGPIHFVGAITLRLMYGRRLYVLHAGGEHGGSVCSYLARIGSIPVLTDRAAMDAVKTAIERDPHCAILVAFDHISGRRRRTVPFLGGTLSAPTGLAYLANETRAAVITVWWELTRSGPRVRVGDLFGVDRSLPHDERRDDLHDRMFRALEARVKDAPGSWTEWERCHDA